LTLNKTVNLSVKDGLPLAAIPIFAGVILAFLVYRWTKGGRAQALRRLRIAQAQARVQSTGFEPTSDNPIGSTLFRMLADLQTSNEVGVLTEVQLSGGLDDVNARVDGFLQAQEMDRRLEKFIADFGPVLGPKQTAFASDWRAAFDQFQELLAAQAKFDPAAITGLRNKYADVRGQILTELAAFLAAQLEELKELPVQLTSRGPRCGARSLGRCRHAAEPGRMA
jgi:hypothetical protein